MNEGVPPPSARAAAAPPQVVRAPDGSLAWVVSDAGPIGISFGLIELDEGKIGLEVNGVAAGSQASIVPGLAAGMVLQQIDEFHIRASTPQQLDIMASAAMTERRPLTLVFKPATPPEDTTRDLVATFTEPGPLGLDFALTQNPDFTYGMVVRGVAESSAASAIEGMRAGLTLKSISNGDVAIRAWSPQELDAICSAAMGARRPITLRFLSEETVEVEDLVATFSEDQTGPLGLDFGLTMLPGGMVGIAVGGVKAESHASTIEGLQAGMVLKSVGGIEISAETPAELGEVMETAMSDARPIDLVFAQAAKPVQYNEVEATFTEVDTGPLGFDFQMTQLPDGSFALCVAGIAAYSHASMFPEVKVGMLLSTLSQGDFLLRSRSPYELNAVMNAAMNQRRPLSLRFGGLDGVDLASIEVSRTVSLLPQMGSPKWSKVLSNMKEISIEKRVELQAALQASIDSLSSLENGLTGAMAELYSSNSASIGSVNTGTVGGLDAEFHAWMALVSLAETAGIKGETDTFAKEVGRMACASMEQLESTLAGLAPGTILLGDGTVTAVTGEI